MCIALTAFIALFGAVANTVVCYGGDAAVYDFAGNLTRATWAEPVKGVLKYGNTLEFAYDEMRAVTNATLKFLGKKYTVGYERDIGGRVTATDCGMQGLGVPRDAANIVDAGMSIVGMGGISAVEIACARNSSQLSRVTCVSTDYGMAVQSNSKAARVAAGKVKNGATVYEGGVLGVSETTKSQFLSLENPLSEGYAMRYGVPPKNAKFDFVLTGEVPAGCNFITRPAVPVGSNVGGAIEVVVPANAFKINSFYMP